MLKNNINNISKYIVVLAGVLGLASCASVLAPMSAHDTAGPAISEDLREAVQVLNEPPSPNFPPVVSLTWQDVEPIEVPVVAKKPQPVFNAWVRVRNGFKLDLEIENARIRMQRKWYARHQEYMDRVANRADRYLFHVIEAIEARGVPAELALLPIVESAFDPFAYSHGRASGMWQFIPGTGTRFGMKQDWWYDGRRDIVDSTRGALDYLEHLHKTFDGDWLLALAAYNSGEGNVARAIRYNRRHGKATDFWSLRLPRETRAYVPKLIALAQLLEQPAKYGLQFRKIPNQPYFARVAIGSQIDLAQAANLAEIELEELYLLNPGFNQWATSPDGPHFLNVPVENQQVFRANLASFGPEKRISWVRHQIRNGDSLSAIARKHGTTADALRQVNNLRSNRIRTGRTLFIPVASKSSKHYTLSATQRLVAKQEHPASSGKTRHEHVTRSGESFWTISRKYGVGMRQLARWNGMATRDPLRVGQKLVVWSKPLEVAVLSPSADREIIRQIGYKVRNGDSLDRIARKFNVSIGDIPAIVNRPDVVERHQP